MGSSQKEGIEPRCLDSSCTSVNLHDGTLTLSYSNSKGKLFPFPLKLTRRQKNHKLTCSTLGMSPICWLSSRSAQIMSTQSCVDLLIEEEGHWLMRSPQMLLIFPPPDSELPINTPGQSWKAYGERKHYPIKSFTPEHHRTLTDPWWHPKGWQQHIVMETYCHPVCLYG